MKIDERKKQVIEVLRETTEPIGPTEIARRINEAWCWSGGMPEHGYPYSQRVCVVLKRIDGLVRTGRGLYSLP